MKMYNLHRAITSATSAHGDHQKHGMPAAQSTEKSQTYMYTIGERKVVKWRMVVVVVVEWKTPINFRTVCR
jgi:hypothetical protein